MFYYYKDLIRLRHEEELLTESDYQLLLEDEKVFDPKAYGKAGIAAVKELVMARMKVCGCDGKAE